MEHQRVVEPSVGGVDGREHLQRAGRWCVVVELGIALVEDDEKIVATRGLDRPPHLDRCDHAPVRIRGRAQVENRRAGPGVLVHECEVEREFRKSAMGEIARLRAHHDGRRPVGLVERVLHYCKRRSARRTGRDRRGEVQALATARDRRDLRIGIDPAARGRIAALEIALRRAAELGRADRRRVAIPQMGVRRDGLGEQWRGRILRLAHGHADRRQSRIGCDVREQLVQPAKRRIEARDALVQQRVHRRKFTVSGPPSPSGSVIRFPFRRRPRPFAHLPEPHHENRDDHRQPAANGF